MANRLSEIPAGAHYAILTQGSTYVPGDERSRTNPGHGYPGGTEYHLIYRAFQEADRAEWEAAIAQLLACRDSFRAFYVKSAIVMPQPPSITV